MARSFREERSEIAGVTPGSAEPEAETLNNLAVNEPPADSFATVQMEAVKKEGASVQGHANLTRTDASQGVAMQAHSWLSRAATAKTFEERLVCLSQAASLAPEQPTARQWIYETLKHFLARKPFLRYAHESQLLYRVSTADGLALTVPKDRAVSPPYPPIKPTPLRPVFRWFGLSLLGLLLAGLGTLVCAPITPKLASSASRHAPDRASGPERVRYWYMPPFFG